MRDFSVWLSRLVVTKKTQVACAGQLAGPAL